MRGSRAPGQQWSGILLFEDPKCHHKAISKSLIRFTRKRSFLPALASQERVSTHVPDSAHWIVRDFGLQCADGIQLCGT
jgi:hypothetical protein